MTDQDLDSTPPAEGDQGNTDGQQDASQTEQSAGAGQDAGQGLTVDNQAKDAPSTTSQGRSQQNFTRAQERVLERKLEKMLSPFIRRFDEFSSKFNQPPAQPVQNQQDVQIDYNDLPGSINRLVEMSTQKRLAQFEKEKLSGLDRNLDEKLTVREARNILLSQPEIGGDEDKLEDIQQIMKKERLDLVAMNDPVWAVQKAVSIWKQGRKNPNAPPKDTLTTITGGANRSGHKGYSVDELKKLQNIVASDAPEEDKQAAYKRIDEISGMPVA